MSIANEGGFTRRGNRSQWGTLIKTGATDESDIRVAFSDTGTVQVLSGTLSMQGTFSNFSATTNTLTGGTYDVSATLQFVGAEIVTNAAAIILTGSAAQIIDQSDNNALLNFATNTAAGTFVIQGGSNFTTSGAFSNAGSVTVGARQCVHGDRRLTPKRAAALETERARTPLASTTARDQRRLLRWVGNGHR